MSDNTGNPGPSANWELGRLTVSNSRLVLLAPRAYAEIVSELWRVDAKNTPTRLFQVGYRGGENWGKHDFPTPLDEQADGEQIAEKLRQILLFFGWSSLHSWGQDPFLGEFLITNSVEIDAFRLLEIPQDAPRGVCYIHAGFISGYLSTALGKSSRVKEAQCAYHGGTFCRFVVERSSRRRKRTAESPAVPTDALVSMTVASANMRALYQKISEIAKTSAAVLLIGETGVGKELLARHLHAQSNRSHRALVAVNCAALPDTLLEAELFGVEKGAYTGATVSRPGRFELANGGTLFLDEVADLSPVAQAKLLRVLQDGTFERLGSNVTRRSEFRLVCASTERLHLFVSRGLFRKDLYFRIGTVPIHIPPLRQRVEDIKALVEHFVVHFAEKYAKRPIDLDEEAWNQLLSYSYPGNVRELASIIERVTILESEVSQEFATSLVVTNMPDPENENHDIREEDPILSLTTRLVNTGLNLDELKQRLISSCLESNGGNITKTARQLGLTRRQMSYYVNKQLREKH